MRNSSAFVLLMLGVSIASTASARDQSPGALSELIGCWQKEIRHSTEGGRAEKGNLIPALQFCFRKDGTISGYYAEVDGLGVLVGDLEKTWSFREPSTMVIDDEPCVFDQHIDRQHFRLSNCTYKGEWRRE
ncbi:MAG TPA: hypothetical protein VKC66_28145 [Xanthobacteraceae bacterium]|nr:hypothetical protein [Xanthobacteraceae bacterium]